MAKSCVRALMICGLTALLPFDVYAQDVIPPKVYSTTPGGINVSDGTFVYSATDLAIGPLTLERFHLAGAKKPNDPYIGKNMSHNFDIYVAPNRKMVSDPYKPIVHIGNSASGVYVQGSILTSVNDNNLDARKSGILSYSGGNYSYTDRSGNIYSFTSTVPAAGVPWISQRVSQIVFADGRTQTFSYNASKQLKLVSDSSGYAILFDYNAAGDVSAACGFNLAVDYVTPSSTCASAALKVSYGYDGNGLLTSAVAVDGQITTYSGGVGGITCVKPPGYASCQLSMDGPLTGRVSQQTMADGAVWNIGSSSIDND